MKNIFKNVKITIFIVFMIASLSLFLFEDTLNFNSEAIKTLVLKYEKTSYLIFISLIGMASATTLPISAVSFVGILIFPLWKTVFYTMIGILIASIIVYYLSLYLGRDFVQKYSKLKTNRLNLLTHLIKNNLFGFVILLNFVYFFPSNLGHMVAGMNRLKISKFLFATIVGNFLNSLAVILLFIAILNNNLGFIFLAFIIAILTTLIPLIVFRKIIKQTFIIVFGKKTYNDLTGK